MKRWFYIFFSLVTVTGFMSGLSLAGNNANQTRPDLQDIQKAEKIYDQVRCLVCDGQSLAGSQAQIAIAMRRNIMQNVQQGQSEARILEDLQAKYGDKILLSPPYQKNTYILWLLPVVILILAGIWLMRIFRTADHTTTDHSVDTKTGIDQ